MEITRLLVIVSLSLIVGKQDVVAAPPADNQKLLNKDEVKYIRDEVEKAILQNEVAKEMLMKPIDDDQPDPVQSKKSCFDDGDGLLNEWSLEHLINTVSPNTFINAPVVGNTFYATIDYGRTLVDNSDPLRVLWPSALRLNSNQSPPPDKILLNFPPYVNTSLFLIGTFGEGSQKPAIGILGMFGVDSLSMTIDRMKCLAKMKYMGFTLTPWNMDDFKASVNDACDDRIEQAVSTNSFTDELKNVEKLIQFVTEMSQNPNVQNWCLTTPTVLANMQSHVMKMRY